MPFIGKDWRSPGEAWVKTEALGWQRAKIVAHQLRAGGASWPPNCQEEYNAIEHDDDAASGCQLDSSGQSPATTDQSDQSSSPSPSPSPERLAGCLKGASRRLQCQYQHQKLRSQPIAIASNSNRRASNKDDAVSMSPPAPSPPSPLHRQQLQPRNSAPTPLSNSLPTSVTRNLCDDMHRLARSSKNNQSTRSLTAIASAGGNFPHCVRSFASNYPQHQQTAPHCQITLKPTREVVMYNTISEAFCQLDFCNAIHDIRRFNYICKLLHLLITQNLTSLSGGATKILFSMLEQIAAEVSSNKRNVHVIRNLLNDLKLTIAKYYCWGRPIGSSVLWQQHFDTIERISRIVDGIELSPPTNAATTSFNDLPVEMVREILLRLNDYRDLLSSAQAHSVMRSMIRGQFIWRQLCRYHFTSEQMQLSIVDHWRGRRLGGSTKYARFSSPDGLRSYRSALGAASTPPPSSSSFAIAGTSRHSCNANTISNGFRQSSQPLVTSKVAFEPPLQPKTNELNAQYSQQQPTVDWESLFHEMRKKFDLKEEYADCLLLCRTCRCLFWRSFGHPCIESSSSPQHRGETFLCESLLAQSQHMSRSSHELRHQSPAPEAQQPVPARLSVAALSRNFDQRSASVERFEPRGDQENVEPRQVSHRPRRALATPSLGSPQQQHQNGIGLQASSRNNNNKTGACRKKELVPRHVTISPQAFLKFFSL